MEHDHHPHLHDFAGMAVTSHGGQPAVGLANPEQNSSELMDDEVGFLDLRMPHPVAAVVLSNSGR
jgi:hypothetical protein